MEYISNFTAAYKWNIPLLNDVLGTGYYQRKYGDKEDKNYTIEMTVSDKNRCFFKKGYFIHLCKVDLPSGAIVKHNNEYISSPELVFLELANRLNFHQLVLLGLQMCSHKVGQKEKSVTTKRKLNIFINKVAGHNGYPNAKRALRYIEDGSASIMESYLFMMLVLPHKLGGYGLKGACFNYKIPLTEIARRRLEKEKCYIDIYYPQKKLGIEYNSFAKHNNKRAQENDAIRSDALKRQKISLTHVVTRQFYNKDVFEAQVENIAFNLGKRISIRTKKFEEEHKKLRAMLPRINDKDQ